MSKIALKIIISALSLYGVINLAQDIKPLLGIAASDPRVANSNLVKGAIDSANQVLPESKQLVLPAPTPIAVPATITQIITEKVTEITKEASSNVKEAAKSQVCREITKQIEKECANLE